MKTIKSKVLGTLQQHDRFEDWWESGEVEIPFFDNKKMLLTFQNFVPEKDTTFITDADKALKQFLAKGKLDRLEISGAVHADCMAFLNAVGYDEMDRPMWEIKDKTKIWNFIQPQCIYVSRGDENDQDIYIALVCDCEWEQEHGLQVAFENGTKLSNVGEQSSGFVGEIIDDWPMDNIEIPNQVEETKSGFFSWLKKWWS